MFAFQAKKNGLLDPFFNVINYLCKPKNAENSDVTMANIPKNMAIASFNFKKSSGTTKIANIKLANAKINNIYFNLSLLLFKIVPFQLFYYHTK